MERSASVMASDGSGVFVPVLVGSRREGRRSIHVARFVHGALTERAGVAGRLVDLAECDLPVMRRRASEAGGTVPGLGEFHETVARADGLVIVTPEYKNGYPGVLKNALDYLDAGIFRRKPIGIVTVSSGGFGGLNCLAQLRLVCLAMGGVPIPAALPVSRVDDAFDEQGVMRDPRFTERLASCLDEFLWYARALTRQRRCDAPAEATG